MIMASLDKRKDPETKESVPGLYKLGPAIFEEEAVKPCNA